MPLANSALERYADEVWDRFEKVKKFEEYDRIKAENEKLRRANQELSVANQTLKLENGNLTRRLQDIECENNRLTGDLSEIQTSLDEALAKRAEFESEIIQLKPKFEELEKELSGTRSELRRLRSSQVFTRLVVDPSKLANEDLRLVVETIKRDLLKPLEEAYRGRLTAKLIVQVAGGVSESLTKLVRYLVGSRSVRPDYACPQCRGQPTCTGEGALICTRCHLEWFMACPQCGSKMKYIPQDQALHCTSCTLRWK